MLYARSERHNDQSVARDDGRVERKVRLTPPAFEELERFRLRYNVTFNSLIEAIGRHMAEHPDWMPDEVGRAGQAIDQQNYSRRPRD
jgi:hypothetical protein